jgi:hypothetical protein
VNSWRGTHHCDVHLLVRVDAQHDFGRVGRRGLRPRFRHAGQGCSSPDGAGTDGRRRVGAGGEVGMPAAHTETYSRLRGRDREPTAPPAAPLRKVDELWRLRRLFCTDAIQLLALAFGVYA